MKTIDHILIGLVINNQDPDNRGRVQVFIPQLTNLYTDWNQNKENIKFRTLDSDIFSPEIIQRLSDVLPWADVASPFFGGGTASPVNTEMTEPIPSPTDEGLYESSDDVDFETPLDEMNILEPYGADTEIVDGMRIKKGVDVSGLDPRVKKFAQELSARLPYAVISSGQDGNHATGTYSHGNGYKVDIRMNGGSTKLTPEQKSELEITSAQLAAKNGLNVLVENDNTTNGHLDVGYNPTKDPTYSVRNGFSGFESTSRSQAAYYAIVKNNSNKKAIGLSTKQGEPEEIVEAPLPEQDPSSAGEEVDLVAMADSDKEQKEEQNDTPVVINRDVVPPASTTSAAYAGSSLGMFSTPQAGAKAYVMFLGGNPMRPIVVGCFTEPKNYQNA